MSGKLLILVTLVGLFFYSFRLKDTQVFTDDTARDTLKALLIWQKKEITAIGPPASFSLNTIREVYFGSLYLYIGIIGLLLANWDPIGAVWPNTFLFTLSIPLFYKFLSSQIINKLKLFFGVLLYTFSPITVIHSRFFWNPNLIIPFSILFWYLITLSDKSKKRIVLHSLSAGIVAGIMFNFHYITALPIFSFLIILFLQKQKLKSLLIFAALLITNLPLFVFELRNNFYLTGSFWFNVVSQGTSLQTAQVAFLEKLGHLVNIFGAFLGLKPAEVEYPTFSSVSPFFLIFIVLIIIYLCFLNFSQSKKIDYKLLLPLILSIITTVYFSSSKELLIRYLFAVYPILILSVTTILFNCKFKYLALMIFIPILYASIGILYDDAKLGKSYISFYEIEKICKKILKDSPTERYNITENIRGDARAMAFRYCLNKDTKIKPQNELSYTNLDFLYVVSPSLYKTYQENRWEFSASAPWKLEKEENIGSVNLYKFIK